MLSINILTWNTWPVLHKTLHVLKEELKGIEAEVIIVDNGSTDGCQDAATIKNKENLGISKGKNQGIDASRGEYILLIDGDVLPPRNSIRCLYEYMQARPEIEALGFYPNKWSNQINKNGQKHHEDICERIVDVAEAKGHACYFGMYCRSVFEKGVRFDENFGPGYGWEDHDMFRQMQQLGIKQYMCHINSKAGKYYHAINSSIPQLGWKRVRELEDERKEYFKRKWECLTK